MVRKALKAGVELPKAQLNAGDKKKSNKGVGKGKSTTRKCATCGAIGHIRTNKACPMYNERYGGGSTAPVAPTPQPGASMPAPSNQ